VKAACEELVGRGGARLLLACISAHENEATEQETFLRQLLKILHRLVLYAPLERWMTSMTEVSAAVVSLVLHDNCPPGLYAAALGLAAACANVCEHCRRVTTSSHWQEVEAIICSSLRGEHGAHAVAMASQLVSQVTSARALDHGEDAEVLELLQLALINQWEESYQEEVRLATADALFFASVHCDIVKRQVLEGLGHNGALLPLLAEASPKVVAKILALLRLIVAPDLAEGTLESIVASLNRFPRDPKVQRWGLAALGALGQDSLDYASDAAQAGGIECVLRALSSENFIRNADVHQEAFFCAHSMLRDEYAREEFTRIETRGPLRICRLPELIESILQRSLCNAALASSEMPLWGMRTLERLTATQEGAVVVEPYLDIIVQTILTRDVRDSAVISGSCAVSHLVEGAPASLSRLRPYRVQLVQELQRRALAIESAKDKAKRRMHHIDQIALTDDGVHPVIRAAEKKDGGLKEVVGVKGSTCLIAGMKDQSTSNDVSVGDVVVSQFDFDGDGSVLLLPKSTKATVFKGDRGSVLEIFNDGSGRINAQFEDTTLTMLPNHFKKRDQEQDLQDWARALIDILEGHETRAVDEDLGDPPTPKDSEHSGSEDDET